MLVQGYKHTPASGDADSKVSAEAAAEQDTLVVGYRAKAETVGRGCRRLRREPQHPVKSFG
jgi:hypothetical protein